MAKGDAETGAIPTVWIGLEGGGGVDRVLLGMLSRTP